MSFNLKNKVFYTPLEVCHFQGPTPAPTDKLNTMNTLIFVTSVELTRQITAQIEGYTCCVCHVLTLVILLCLCFSMVRA